MNRDGLFNILKNKGSLRTKFILSFVIIILVVSAINITSYLVLKSSIAKLNDVVQTAILANEITNSANFAIETVTVYITKKTVSDKEKILNYLNIIDRNIISLEKIETDDPGKKSLDLIKGFNTAFKESIEDAINSSDNNNLLTNILKARSVATNIMEYMKKTVGEFIAIELNDNSSLIVNLNTQAQLTLIMFFLAIIIIGLLSILSAVIFSRYNMKQERNEAITAFSASEDKFNKTFSHSADVIGIIRLSDRQYIKINDAFFRIFGYKREEIIGHSSDKFNLWESQKQLLNAYKIMEKEGSFRNIETAWRTKHGDIRIGLNSAEKIDIDDEPCIIFVWNDITERKQAEYLKSTQSKLVQSEKMAGLGTMVAGVAHEINNPINYIYLSSKTLEKDLGEFKQEVMQMITGNIDEVINYFEDSFSRFQRSLNNIIDGSNRTKTIVQDLRTFSRLDEAEKKEVYLAEALELTVRLVKTQYPQIVLTTAFETNGKIECYPAQLNQVFLNIIVNSCQALLEKQKDTGDDSVGTVIIRLCDNGKEIVTAIEDNGCGMTEVVKAKIFEPFFTTKPVGYGTGLGMSISYGIIEKHNGKIDIKSESGKGTTVTVFLPYATTSFQ